MTTIWQVIHEGGTVECQTEEHAKEQAAKLSGSRVVELAPVDQLERAVVEAAVCAHEAYWGELPSDSDESLNRMVAADDALYRAVKALIAARKEGA